MGESELALPYQGGVVECLPVCLLLDPESELIHPPGGVGLLVGQPFDVVKVRYQTPQYNGRYNSILGAFRESAWVCAWWEVA